MAKASPPSRNRLDNLPTRELIARGETLVSTHDYKDAIDVYKLLLKREPQAEAGWREALAAAYLERARQLAGKAMYREAAVLWENLPNLCGQAPHPEDYIDWLLRSGQHAKAMRAYAAHAADRAPAETAELETRLAALALSGQKEVLQALPPDTPLRQHLNAAQAALRAYTQDEPEDRVREALKNISIRSPYRDWRQVLAALLKLETAPAEAVALIERIAPDSPYQSLVEIVRACAAAEPARALLALDPIQRELAGRLLGLDQKQMKLLKDWTRLGVHPNDKTSFDFIIANQATLDVESARRAALALLPAYPAGLKIHTRVFGPLSPFETARLQALRAEREGEIDRALRGWHTCAEQLIQDAGNPDSRLGAALILRHMAELAEDEDLDWGETPKTRGYLEQSLRLDPDDRDVYLKLAKLCREAGDDKEYHQWVERAVKQFPDEPQVLLAAVETATARKAYKKAAGFAARVLELDPINPKARSILINAHLAHARKQILAGKYALAEKELDSAGRLERDNARSGVVELNRGLLASRQRQPERARQQLREGVRLAGGSVLAWLRLAVEAERLNLDPSAFQRDLELGNPRKLAADRADVLALTRAVNAYREEGFDDLGSILRDLERPLKHAIQRLDQEDDLALVCECLHEVPCHELLEIAAARALELHPGQPLFVYYLIYGRAEGDIDDVKDRDYDRLERALEQAKATEDHRAVTAINQFFSQGAFGSPFARLGGPPPMPRKMQREMEEIREQLQQLPPALRGQMLDAILDDLPPDDDFPPEIQRALMKLMLLGGEGLGDILDEMPDFPPPPRGRGGRHKRRS
jgi:cellulose synthase operon protein C